MTDREIEDRLRRFKPSGPPPELKQRVIRSGGSDREPRIGLDWLLPAAAALVLAIFSTLAQSARGQVWADAAARSDDTREVLIKTLSDQLGGDMMSSQLAAVIVDTQIVEEPSIE